MAFYCGNLYTHEKKTAMKINFYHFKHYIDTSLELSENLQVIVGNNGSGKSTLCEALSLLVNASNPHHTSWEEKTSFLKEGRNE